MDQKDKERIQRLKTSRRAHHQRAERREAQADHHAKLARNLRDLEDKQRTIAQTRTRQIREARANAQGGPGRALDEARRYVGKTEQPANSNLAPWGLTQWIKERLGLSHGVPWCGIGVGHCLEVAGVKGITSRVASVYFIYEDAGRHTGGFIKRVGITEGQPGDAVGLFGLSTHVELIEKRVPGGYQTIGFNTNPTNAGSQSNGGGCFRRVRPYSNVVYVARPRY